MGRMLMAAAGGEKAAREFLRSLAGRHPRLLAAADRAGAGGWRAGRRAPAAGAVLPDGLGRPAAPAVERVAGATPVRQRPCLRRSAGSRATATGSCSGSTGRCADSLPEDHDGQPQSRSDASPLIAVGVIIVAAIGRVCGAAQPQPGRVDAVRQRRHPRGHARLPRRRPARHAERRRGRHGSRRARSSRASTRRRSQLELNEARANAGCARRAAARCCGPAIVPRTSSRRARRSTSAAPRSAMPSRRWRARSS